MQAENPPSLFTIRHPFVRIENVLSESEVAGLLARVMQLEPQFQPSVALTVPAAATDVRKSLVINAPADVVRPVVDRVRPLIAATLAALRLPPIQTAEIESQITASNDGAFYGIHTDANKSQMQRRYLTYVYYFNNPPKAFTGGELFLYDDILRENKLATGNTYQAVEPVHNTMVLFWARIMHEVRPVTAPSQLFRDSRFTVNGWVNKAPGSP
jgi:Rps23 Pro-64 3,4-dihydroxylase Tpa1-like proline 4-hydroxylase